MRRMTAILVLLTASCSEKPHPTLGERCKTIGRGPILESAVAVPGQVTAVVWTSDD